MCASFWERERLRISTIYLTSSHLRVDCALCTALSIVARQHMPKVARIDDRRSALLLRADNNADAEISIEYFDNEQQSGPHSESYTLYSLEGIQSQSVISASYN